MLRHSFRQLEYFVAVARLGSVSRAASELNVSQPALSSAIAKLEAALGIRLFIRQSWQGLTLTWHGRWFYAEAQDILERARQLEKGAASLANTLEGVLRLGCYATFGPIFLPRLLAGFRRAYPTVEVTLQELRRASLINKLEDGSVELALAYDVGLPERIGRMPLLDVPSHILLPKGHRLAQLTSVPLADLVAEPFILLDLPGSRDHLLAVFSSLGLTPRIAMRSESCEMVRGLVANGFGYAILNAVPTINRALDGAELELRDIVEPVKPLSLVLASLPDYTPTRLQLAFRQFCTSYFGGMAASTDRGGVAKRVALRV